MFRVCSGWSGREPFLSLLGKSVPKSFRKENLDADFPGVTDRRMNCETNLQGHVDISASESNATQKAIGYNCRLGSGTCLGGERHGSW